MRKFLISLKFSFVFWISSYAQTYQYVPFPDTAAVWNYYWDNSPIHEPGKFYTSGDTLIEGTVYEKILRSWNSYPYYFGAIRTDTLKRVFSVLYGDTTETLLYDFSLSVGDTMFFKPSCPASINPFYFVLDSVHDININNSLRRKLYLRSNLPPPPANTCRMHYPDVWIEGIGSMYGPFSVFPYGPWTGFGLCNLYLRDTLVYSTNNPRCSDYNSINKYQILPLKISPNPASEFVTIESNNFTGIVQLLVYNLVGQVIFYRKEVANNFLRVDVSILNQGTYIFELITQDGSKYYTRVLKN